MSPAPFPRPAVQRWLAKQCEEVRKTGSGRLLAIRGRRQAGKSTAVELFVESCGAPYVFTTGLFGASEAQQLAASAAAFGASRVPLPGQLPGPIGTWQEWFTRVALAASSQPVVAVLDEFPWISADGGAGLEGTLQTVWDRVLEKLPVLVIIIGSDLAMMERLARHDRPLFGRLREFVVPMLTPAEVAGALPRPSAAQTFDDWLITGGYPRLVAELRDAGTDAAEWVRTSFRDQFSPLAATARLTFDAEFSDAAAAGRVLSAIGASERAHLPFGEIVDAVAGDGDATARKTAQTAVLRSLRVLREDKRLVVEDLPAWAASTRLRRYRVADSYLRFWFRSVERHQDAIARGRGDLAVSAFDRDWMSWRGRAIEPIVREALGRLAATDPRLAGVESVGAWWTRDGKHEVDVVATGSERTRMLATVKWRDRGGVTEHDVRALAAARSLVPHSQDAVLAAVCPSGEAPDGVLGFSASDLLGAWTPTE